MTPNLKDGCLSESKIDPNLSEKKIEQLSSTDRNLAKSLID